MGWCRLRITVSGNFLRKSSCFLLLAAFMPLPLSVRAQLRQDGAGPVPPGHHGPSGQASAPGTKPAHEQPLLPPDFAGEPREGNIVIQPSPAGVDPSHLAVLKENGLVETATARYRGSGPADWTIQVLRFGDATGAYSAFTFYRGPAMRPEPVGENAAANPSVFLARRDASLVVVSGAGVGEGAPGDATRLEAAMPGLLQSLPRLGGPEAVAPSLPGLMPTAGLENETLHYAIGPASYNGPLPVSSIDFKRDAEVATALYRLHSGGTATLTLLMLPTPQIAGAALRTVAALPDGAMHVATRRTGPLVGIVSGAGVSKAEADRLLGQIRYVSDLTLDQPQGYTSEVAKAAKLLVGIAWLTALLALAALVVAVFLGVGRVLVRRLRGKPDSSLNDDDFISLKL